MIYFTRIVSTDDTYPARIAIELAILTTCQVSSVYLHTISEIIDLVGLSDPLIAVSASAEVAFEVG